MKEIEMAEEWVSSEEYQRDRPIEPFSTDECSNDWAELAKYAEYMLPKAFLAGLKAGRPQWHDLREDPNDLPKKDGKYWVCYEILTHYRCTITLTYGKYNNSPWFDSVRTYDKGVIAWCEIPTFDKE